MTLSDANTSSLLPDPADEQVLKNLVLPFTEACPDLHDMAHEAAQGILDKHNIKGIDPDQVWWHRFGNTSVSSNTAFLGWEHFPPTSQSLTLPQLVGERFRAHDQDNADLLDAYGGFYNQGPKASIFNETNEVRMYPSAVLKDLWTINFNNLYREKMESFWRNHSDNFRTLAKLNFLSKALDEHDDTRLSNENLKTVIKAVAGNVTWPISLDLLQEQAPTIEGLRVCPLDIGGYQATDILCITDRNGVQILYTPGETNVFHIFTTMNDLHWWLLAQNNDVDVRARFMAHFPLAAQQQEDDNIGLNGMIDLLYSTWGRSDHHLINQKATPIEGDVFSWLRDSVKARMHSDADLSLHSNGELREKLWIGYLNAFVRVFGSMAAAGWPMALAVVGAGIADLGLNINQAINGKTRAERKAGVAGAISIAIENLFNLFFALGAAELAEVGEAGETFELQDDIYEPPPGQTPGIPTIDHLAPGPVYAEHGEDVLSVFETNEILDGMSPVASNGKYHGIYQPPSGGNYVQINDSYYLVRYINELESWAIIDPASPKSFHRNLPIRLDAQGEWRPISRPNLLGTGKVSELWPWGGAHAPLPEVETPTTPYDTPSQWRNELNRIANGGGTKYELGDEYAPDVESEKGKALLEFRNLRNKLYQDANGFLESYSLPQRPEIPALPQRLSPKDLIKKLYRIASGVVIGENHSSVGSKQFLIENMPVLSKQQVKTLYLEHLQTDFHQADLDVFNSNGELSENLEGYLKDLDRGHGTDPSGQYTFLEVVKAARANHIRIQAIDCLASYRTTGMKDVLGTFRQRMMNFFAYEVISADQASRGAHRWVALVGDSHANTWQGVPGVAELEGAIGLRVESADPGTAGGIEVDPGRMSTDSLGRPQPMVKSDLRLQLDTPSSVTLAESLEKGLRQPGDCTLMNIDGKAMLIHRSSSGAIVRTPVLRDGAALYIERENWPSISGRRYAGPAELSAALQRIGMRTVRITQP